MLVVRNDEEGLDVTVISVSINTECHRTCLGDVLAILACRAPDVVSLLKHLDYVLESQT